MNASIASRHFGLGAILLVAVSAGMSAPSSAMSVSVNGAVVIYASINGGDSYANQLNGTGVEPLEVSDSTDQGNVAGSVLALVDGDHLVLKVRGAGSAQAVLPAGQVYPYLTGGGGLTRSRATIMDTLIATAGGARLGHVYDCIASLNVQGGCTGVWAGEAVAGRNDASARISVSTDNDFVIYTDDLSVDGGHTNIMPQGEQLHVFSFGEGETIHLAVSVAAYTDFNVGNSIGNGSVDLEADLSHTVRWDGIVGVFDVTAGDSIPIADFHLLDESGVDWAHPAAVLGVERPGPSGLALRAPSPNPARGGRLNVSFTLPSAGVARLEVLDVTGRRVAEREVGSLGPGAHTVDLTVGRTFSPGLYLVRLSQGSLQRVARVAMLE